MQAEFGLNDTMYGLLQTAFNAPYAVVAPFAGLLIDRIGLTRAISLAVGLWSCAGIATGLTHGLGSLIVCRALLGIAEAAGIPAAGKAIAIYVKPGERAMGHAMNQAAVQYRHDARTRAGDSDLGTLGLASRLYRHGHAGPAVDSGVARSGAAPAPVGRGGQLCSVSRPPAVDHRGRQCAARHSLLALVRLDHQVLRHRTFGLDLAGANALRVDSTGLRAGRRLSVRLGLAAPHAAGKRPRDRAPQGLLWARRLRRWPPGWCRWRRRLRGPPPQSRSASAPSRASASTSTRCRSICSANRARRSPSRCWSRPTAPPRRSSRVAIGWTRDHYGYLPVTTIAAVTPLIACAVLRA